MNLRTLSDAEVLTMAEGSIYFGDHPVFTEVVLRLRRRIEEDGPHDQDPGPRESTEVTDVRN